jgi:hypothetical protein
MRNCLTCLVPSEFRTEDFVVSLFRSPAYRLREPNECCGAARARTMRLEQRLDLTLKEVEQGQCLVTDIR